MLLTKEQKKQIVADLTDKISRAKTAIFTDYRGLKVKDMQALRRKLRPSGIDLKVAKNNLLDLALRANKIDVNGDIYQKPLMTAFAYQDEIEPCRLLSDFCKENPSVEIVGGILEKNFISKDEIKKLASLPTREVLYAQVVGSIAAPLSGLVNVLQGNLRGLVSVLNQYKEKIS